MPKYNSKERFLNFMFNSEQESNLSTAIQRLSVSDTPTVPKPTTDPGLDKQWVWHPESESWIAVQLQRTAAGILTGQYRIEFICERDELASLSLRAGELINVIDITTDQISVILSVSHWRLQQVLLDILDNVKFGLTGTIQVTDPIGGVYIGLNELDELLQIPTTSSLIYSDNNENLVREAIKSLRATQRKLSALQEKIAAEKAELLEQLKIIDAKYNIAELQVAVKEETDKVIDLLNQTEDKEYNFNGILYALETKLGSRTITQKELSTIVNELTKRDTALGHFVQTAIDAVYATKQELNKKVQLITKAAQFNRIAGIFDWLRDWWQRAKDFFANIFSAATDYFAIADKSEETITTIIQNIDSDVVSEDLFSKEVLTSNFKPYPVKKQKLLARREEMLSACLATLKTALKTCFANIAYIETISLNKIQPMNESQVNAAGVIVNGGASYNVSLILPHYRRRVTITVPVFVRNGIPNKPLFFWSHNGKQYTLTKDALFSYLNISNKLHFLKKTSPIAAIVEY